MGTVSVANLSFRIGTCLAGSESAGNTGALTVVNLTEPRTLCAPGRLPDGGPLIRASKRNTQYSQRPQMLRQKSMVQR